jgi:site-specific DNA-adenine methylase
MLRMNDTNDELVCFFEKMDKEFQTLENVIKSTLEITYAYEKQIEETKQE